MRCTFYVWHRSKLQTYQMLFVHNICAEESSCQVITLSLYSDAIHSIYVYIYLSTKNAQAQ